MDNLYHFKEYNEAIFRVYQELDIKNLSQIKFDGKNSGSFFNDILSRKYNIKPFPYSQFKIHDEFDSITKDLKYIIGATSMLRPYIIDSEIEDGKYIQTLEDRRYLMYSSFGFQCVYNFWDRIGDLLFMYFSTGLQEHKVILSTVLNNIPTVNKSSDEYISLFKFYEDNIKPFLEDRNLVVHYFQLETRFYWGNIEFAKDPEERLKLNQEKYEIVDRLKEMLAFCIKGFELTLRFIETLPNRTFFTFKLDELHENIESIIEVRELYNVRELEGIKYESEDILKSKIQSIIGIQLDLINVMKTA